MSRSPLHERLVAEVQGRLSPLRVHIRRTDRGAGAVVDLLRADGSVLWPNYTEGPDELLTTLAAGQRYLVEQVGNGAMPGDNYLDKAREWLRRADEPDS